MQRSVLWLITFLTGVVACHRTNVDPELLVPEITISESLRPVYLSSKVVDNQFQVTITPQGPVVCCCAPCPQASYATTEKYEVQIAFAESGPYQSYKTIAVGDQEKEQVATRSVVLPNILTIQPIVVRVVAIGESGKVGYVRAIMNSTSPMPASIREISISEQDNLLSLTFNPVRQQVAYVTYVQDASFTIIPTLRVADYANGQLLNKRLLTPAGFSPVFSRDGKQLAYLLPSQAANSSQSLVIHDIDANTNRILELSGIMWVGSYSWSPDGQWIAFLEQNNEYTRLWKINLTDGKQEAITPVMPYKQPGGLWQGTIDWAPDGKAIVASRSVRNTDSDWRFGLSFISPANGTFLSDIPTLVGWADKYPAYSPDGQQVVFISSRADNLSNQLTLWIRNLTTNQLRHVRLPGTYQLTDSFRPQWADNNSLLITAYIVTTNNTVKSVNLVVTL